MTVIDTSTAATATGYSNQRKIDRCQNGVLWMTFYNGNTNDAATESKGGNAFEFWYSEDDGATWVADTPLGYVSGGTSTPNSSLFIDVDDYAHFVFKDGGNNNIYYRRGTPNAARTAWTWTAPRHLTFAQSSAYQDNLDYPDIVAHREGTGWKVHAVASLVDSSSYNGCAYAPINVASDGTITTPAGSTLLGSGYSNIVPKWPSIDFRHTGDGKTVSAGGPDLYVAWSAGATGSGKGIRYKRATYGSGSWTWGTEQEVDSGRYIHAHYMWLNCMFDGTNVVLVGNLLDSGVGRDLMAYIPGDPGGSSFTAHELVGDATTAEGFIFGAASYDGDRNIHIVGQHSDEADGSKNLVHVKWDRAALGAETVIDSTTKDPYASLKRGYSNNKIEFIYTDGTSSPYNVTYDAITLNQPPTQPGAFTEPIADQVVDTSVDPAWGAATDPDGNITGYRLEYTLNNGGSWTLHSTEDNLTRTVDTSAWASTTTAKFRVRAVDAGGLTSAWRESPTFTVQHNQPPTAPTGLAPDGSILDRTAAQVLSWVRNDPDAGDYQTKYQWRYRLAGTTEWTTSAEVTSGTTQREVAADFFAAGDYEWQVRLADSQGEWSPWSASAFFTAAEPPPAPTIQSPANGSTVATADSEVAWSTASQGAFQVRRVADDAGSADPATIHYDSGTRVSTSARNHALTFATNDRWEHVQVRIRQSGLWSTWASVRVQVSYESPAEPTVAAAATPEGWLAVAATHPVPVDPQPAVANHDVYRRRVGSSDPEGTRVAADVAPGAVWIDALVGHREHWEYRVEARGENGTRTSSAWTA